MFCEHLNISVSLIARSMQTVRTPRVFSVEPALMTYFSFQRSTIGSQPLPRILEPELTTAQQLCDYFLTLDDEINYYWPARWTLGKVLFFLTRYPPFVSTALILYRQSSCILIMLIAVFD